MRARGHTRRSRHFLAVALLVCAGSAAAASCPAGTLYLTFDTGHMEPATAIADILKKHGVKATFFLANEKVKEPGKSREASRSWTLDEAQRPFWQRLVAEGHAFGSHTWDHHYLRGDVGADRVRYVPWGAREGRLLDQAAFCEELRKPERRFRELTGRGFDGLWRAPGGKVTARALAWAEACGYRHVHWSEAGFLGDELPSEAYPNALLVKRALERLRDGDILMAHLGIWSRREPFWPALDPLIAGLKAKGFCFATLERSLLGTGINHRVMPRTLRLGQN
ncbi:MAG: polysaccharide deacetylase family protein [Casimicrobiaceae bacterium]|nr:polysaccharide deacetylase family protein [Casimicrobiaceae bacterium]MDW8311622.1 polysaccharide deacetylase family protein [Burkholderiales bacterium]